MDFEKNVFINCPYDEKYLELLRPLIFTILYLGMNPRFALERTDSSEARIQKIISLIESSRYGIHDLSRLKATKKGEYFRLNMPFELGIDVGCKLFKEGKWSSKKCLILEAEHYRYQAALSDLSNSDILVHGNEPKEIITQVRNWLNSEAGINCNGPSAIWGAFIDFMADNYDQLKARGFSDNDIEKLPVNELLINMKIWLEKNA